MADVRNRIYDAATDEDWNKATELIRSGVKPDEGALQWAVAFLDSDWVELLLDAGAPVSLSTLSNAMIRPDGDIKVAEMLIKAGAEPKWGTRRYVRRHKGQDWQELFSKEPPPRARGCIESEELHGAVLRGEFAEAERGAAGVIPSDKTVLLAIRKLDEKWVQMLVDAMVESGCKPSSSLLLKAITEKSEAKADILIKAGAVPDDRIMIFAGACFGAAWIKKQLAAQAQTEKSGNVTGFNQTAAKQNKTGTAAVRKPRLVLSKTGGLSHGC